MEITAPADLDWTHTRTHAAVLRKVIRNSYNFGLSECTEYQYPTLQVKPTSTKRKCGMSHFPISGLDWSLGLMHIMHRIPNAANPYIYSFWHLAHISTVCISFIWSSTPATSNHTSSRPRWQPGTHECHERLPSLATALSPLRPWTYLAVGFGRSATSAIRLELQPGAFQKRDPFRGAKKDAGFREGWFEFQTSTVRRARNDISVADSLEFGFHFEHACALSSNFTFQLYSLWKQCVDAAFPQSYTIITSNVQAGKNILSLTVQHFLCMPFSVSLHFWFYRRI